MKLSTETYTISLSNLNSLSTDPKTFDLKICLISQSNSIFLSAENETILFSLSPESLWNCPPRRKLFRCQIEILSQPSRKFSTWKIAWFLNQISIPSRQIYKIRFILYRQQNLNWSFLCPPEKQKNSVSIILCRPIWIFLKTTKSKRSESRYDCA